MIDSSLKEAFDTAKRTIGRATEELISQEQILHNTKLLYRQEITKAMKNYEMYICEFETNKNLQFENNHLKQVLEAAAKREQKLLEECEKLRARAMEFFPEKEME